MVKPFIIYVIFALAFLTGEGKSDPVRLRASAHDSGYNVQLDAFGTQQLLNLQRAEESVLSSGFQMFNVDVDENGKPVFKQWIPSENELNSANEIYIDPRLDSKAVFKIKEDNETGEISLNGVAGDFSVVHDGKLHFASKIEYNKTDYVYINNETINTRTFTAKQNEPVNAIVEIVIILDKEFGDVFAHDNRRILNYLTVYMWDLNLRYKSLPSDNISFRVNGVIVISTTSAQPFIENARASDGRAEFGRILDLYTPWVYSQLNSLPKFDMAPLITNTQLEWGGGLAWVSGACRVDNGGRRHLGTVVFNDNGGWGSLTVGAHEIAHNLGAPHDDDPNFPGGCSDRGFIMGGGNADYRYFFSSCSNRLISAFVRSDAASCLRTIEGPINPVIDPSYSNPKAPTMEEQCKLYLNDNAAYILQEDTFDCKVMRCRIPIPGGTRIYSLATVENANCGNGGRCLRGRCRQQGYMFKNVGSGLCMRASNPFAFTALADMIICPSDGTPLERFVIENSSNGFNLATPFTYDGNKENGEKCLYTGNAEGNAILTDRCNPDNPWHGWDFRDAGNGQFLLVHRVTGRCARPTTQAVGSSVQTFGACNAFDANMRWTRYV